MSTTASDLKTDDWVSHNLDNDPEPESEKRFDSEKYQQRSESERFDFRAEAEKGDSEDVPPELQKEEYKSEPEKGDYKSEPEKGDYKSEPEKGDYKSESEKGDHKSESEKGDFKTESEDSDLESDRSQAGSEVFDLPGIQITGCGDGTTELSTDIIIDEASPKTTVTIRRRRGVSDSGSTLKESTTDQFQSEQRKDDASNFKNEDQMFPECPIKVTRNASAVPGTSLTEWVRYIAPKTMCLIVLSLIYLGFAIFGFKVMSFSGNST